MKKIKSNKKVKLNKLDKLGKFEKFDCAEKEIKKAKNTVVDLGNDFEEGEVKGLLTKAAMDLEKAEAEVEEADEDSF